MSTAKITAQHVLDLLTKSGAMTAKEIAAALNKELKTKISHTSINKSQKKSEDKDVDPEYPGIFKIPGIYQDKTDYKWYIISRESSPSPKSKQSETSSEVEELRQQLKEKTDECERLTQQLMELRGA